MLLAREKYGVNDRSYQPFGDFLHLPAMVFEAQRDFLIGAR